MVQIESGEWYCAGHALLLVARELVSLYRLGGEANWAVISAIIDEDLTGIVAKAETRLAGKRH